MTLPTIASAITFLEAEIDAINVKRSRLIAALDGLRMLADAGEDAQPISTALKGHTGPARPLSPALRQTTEAGQEKQDKVLDALSSGPLSPKEIQQRTGINEKTIAHVFRRLLALKLVTKTGKTWSTRYQLTT